MIAGIVFGVSTLVGGAVYIITRKPADRRGKKVAPSDKRTGGRSSRR